MKLTMRLAVFATREMRQQWGRWRWPSAYFHHVDKTEFVE